MGSTMSLSLLGPNSQRLASKKPWTITALGQEVQYSDTSNRPGLPYFIADRWFWSCLGFFCKTQIRFLLKQAGKASKQEREKKKEKKRKEILPSNEKQPEAEVRALTVNKWVLVPSVDRGSTKRASCPAAQPLIAQQAAISNKYFHLLGKKIALFPAWQWLHPCTGDGWPRPPRSTNCTETTHKLHTDCTETTHKLHTDSSWSKSRAPSGTSRTSMLPLSLSSSAPGEHWGEGARVHSQEI